MKNLIFKILSVFLSSFIIYLLLFSYTYLNLHKKAPTHFNFLEEVIFHKKYSERIHHIRDNHAVKTFFQDNEVNDLLFNKINNLDENKLTVLIQGDSWIEQITYGPDTDFHSFKMLREYGLKNKIEFISGGISSFSPSLMNIQLDILEKDFSIFPDVLIAYIDQTDFGDENCRYKNKKKYENGKLISVEPENYTNSLWDYTKVYELTIISKKYKSNIIKTFHIINFEIKHGFLRLSEKISEFIQDDKQIKCHFHTIENYLINPDKSDIKYFSNVMDNYLTSIKEKKHIKKIIFVTFPHKKHFELNDVNQSIYKLNVSDLVNNAVKNNNDIMHINFSKILLNNSNFDHKNIWKDDDIHLNTINHSNLFINNILKELDNYLEK
tara:strand:+ start:32 stop:1174 length:1143 start_codon:yes stop_codon:yes gene_type:complete